jgi:hypothetical protein
MGSIRWIQQNFDVVLVTTCGSFGRPSNEVWIFFTRLAWMEHASPLGCSTILSRGLRVIRSRCCGWETWPCFRRTSTSLHDLSYRASPTRHRTGTFEKYLCGRSGMDFKKRTARTVAALDHCPSASYFTINIALVLLTNSFTHFSNKMDESPWTTLLSPI